MPQVPLPNLDVVAFADPSGGKSELRRVQARSAIVVIGQDHAEHVFVLDTWAKRTSTDKFIEAIFALNARWRPRQFGIESNAMQTLFADAVRREGRFLAARIPIVNVFQPTTREKSFRNRTAIQPFNSDGRLFVQNESVELHNELATHPMSPTVDLVDALASALGLLRKTPRDVLKSREEDAYATYLRRSGVPPHQIQERLAKLAGELADMPPRPESR